MGDQTLKFPTISCGSLSAGERTELSLKKSSSCADECCALSVVSQVPGYAFEHYTVASATPLHAETQDISKFMTIKNKSLKFYKIYIYPLILQQKVSHSI